MTEPTILTPSDIAFVSNVAEEAALLAKKMREGVAIATKEEPSDKVTAADIAISKLIVSKLSQRFPADTIISEEDAMHPASGESGRLWLVDPIDGTDNYIQNDGQYSVMIGLLVDLQPVFGWVFAPATMVNYYGGPAYGAWKKEPGKAEHKFPALPAIDLDQKCRVLMGYRDRKSNPWVREHPKVLLVKSGSVGLKVAKVLEDDADIFVHLSAKLKTWDTAGPVAIALGAGLDVGSMESDGLPFPSSTIKHELSVVIGRPGALAWSRKHLVQPSKEISR